MNNNVVYIGTNENGTIYYVYELANVTISDFAYSFKY